MTRTPLLERAIELARRAHDGQVDKAGKPYIDHPLRVMTRMKTEEERIVAVLHDVIEDCDVTLDDLRREGFAPEVVEALDSITKRKGEEYEAYLGRVMTNPIALAVKVADMTDNMDLGRIAEPTEHDRRRLEKYQKILPRLQAALRS